MVNKKNNEEEINYWYNLSVYWGFLKRYKWLFVVLLVVGLISESLRLVNPFLFKIIIDNSTNFVAGSIIRTALVSIFISVGLIFLGTILFKAVIEWVNLSMVNHLETSLTLDLKRKFFNHIVDLSHNFHVTHKTGSLISRLGRGGSAMERLTDVLIFNIAPLAFSFIAISVSLIYFSWKPIIVIFVMGISFILYSLYIQNKQKQAGVDANNFEDREKGNVADIFTNIDSIKYYGKEKSIKQRFEKLTERTRRAFLKFYNYYRWMDAGQQIIIGMGTFFLILFPLMDLLNGKMSVGTLVFIYTAYGNIFYPLFGFVHGIRNYYRAMADFDALFKYGKEEQEVKDAPNAQELKVKQGNIEFDCVKFAYGKRKIFKGLNLKVPSGKKIALVGHSGCGKTTLVKLLYRFYDIASGSITIDGQDIRSVKQESLRGEMSIVPQEAILFDESIYNNVAFSNPTATRKEVMQAIKFAQLDKIIKNFPNKENTIVGERGVRLSGGEKQRVSIARAILANKKILVLDEATSALDSETEAEIQRDLKKLMEGRTSIIIAHRLSTIMHADVIVVMKDGNIVQMGKHNQLINRDGEYKRLWNLQRGGYIK